ncbi:MAG: hypothetical protein HZA83_02455 [Thaumarchaeota archaeon]|nr:hypothetical protein [Nitrososphaerota archaeon]
MQENKEKLLGAAGTTSGLLSFLGSYNVCHNACLLTIAALSLVGITLSGLPFLFLQDYAIYFWFLSIGAISVSTFMYVKMKHEESKNWIIANAGFIVAGIPFQILKDYLIFFQVIGGVLIAYAIGSMAIQRFWKK